MPISDKALCKPLLSSAVERPSPKITAWLVSAHVIATPIITWLAIVYSALGAPWREVSALWHAQAVLLGIWYGLSEAPRWLKRWLSLAGLLWLCSMPTAREVSMRGLAIGFPWTAYLIWFGFLPLNLFFSFIAAAIGLVVSKVVWPRWRLVVTGADSDDSTVPQFSMKQLMVGVAACTPFLLAARLTHDYIDMAPPHGFATGLLFAVVQSPLAAAVALLSAWAALSRRFVLARLAAASIALPLAVALVGYATKYPLFRVVGHVGFEETQLAIALATLLLVRWNGYRIQITE